MISVVTKSGVLVNQVVLIDVFVVFKRWFVNNVCSLNGCFLERK
ncbi:hypothetical protein LHGZ1_1838 [Laribacter hongkongensis]|uniref:Uncharacterized protein n=1 Tax=Laribacter hongkongensis TaxID=168471 RepID=A0A248LJI5_9NEIS|nr:hypothetical protein LHGZ1_1838 [Laribacter hongkongensis]